MIPPQAATIAKDTPITAVDCGAARGLLRNWRHLVGTARVVMVEPDESAHAEIHASLTRDGYRAGEHPPIEVVAAALTRTGGPRALHVAPIRTSSSLYRIREDVSDLYAPRGTLSPTTEVEIDTTTLQAVLDARGVTHVDLIKLDTQGAELEILEGLDASRTGSLLSVELEVAMHGGSLGQPSLSDVQRFLEDNGLELFDVFPKRAHLVGDRPPGYYHREVFGTYPNAPTLGARIWELDAVYFKRHDLVLRTRDEAAVRRLCLAYCTYGFFAHAHFLADKAKEAGILAGADAETIQGACVAWHRRIHLSTAPLNVVERTVFKLNERLAEVVGAPFVSTRNNY